MIHLDRRRLLALAEIGRWVAGRRRRVRVEGDSMLPTLEAGQFVLVDPAGRAAAGDLVVAEHPERPGLLVVKRVAGLDAAGGHVLASDNPAAGTDSRTWGPVAADAIVGTVTIVLDRPLQGLGR